MSGPKAARAKAALGVLAIAAGAAVWSGCGSDDIDQATDEIKDAGESIREDAQEAGGDIADEAQQAGDSIKDEAEQLEDEVTGGDDETTTTTGETTTSGGPDY